MFEDELYITITGINHYYKKKPFNIGYFVKLKKEPDNHYDSNAIKVEVPLFGKVGYVANSHNTIAEGTLGAGSVHAKIPKECAAVIRFMTHSKIIAKVLPNKRLAEVDITLEDIEEEDAADSKK